MQDQISSEFTCKCQKQRGWITESKRTLPCPVCGRVYEGVYRRRALTINAKVCNPIRGWWTRLWRSGVSTLLLLVLLVGCQSTYEPKVRPGLSDETKQELRDSLQKPPGVKAVLKAVSPVLIELPDEPN